MITYRWHDWVNQPKMDVSWHKADIEDELEELREAKGLINRWSEVSDVVYTVTRGRWSGHDLVYPINKRARIAGHIYMFPKYSLRVLFFRRAGKKLGAETIIQCVRNPKKAHKLEVIAQENGLEPEKFVAFCTKQRRYWPLLP